MIKEERIKRQCHVLVSEDIKLKIIKYAKQDNRSITSWVRNILINKINEQEGVICPCCKKNKG